MKTSGLVDYHIHTKYCNHATGEMEEYVIKAIEIGLAQIGFAEHMPVMPQPELCLSYEDLPVYYQGAVDLREMYSESISIRIGAEIDILPEKYDEIRQILSDYPFDYVIGSLHYLDGWPFDQKEYINGFQRGLLEEHYHSFFTKIVEIASSGFCDILGHADNLKRMGFPPPNNPRPYYRKIIEAIGDNGLSIELNTSGIDAPIKEMYPSPIFLRMLISSGVPITLGSDAHAPDQVGRHFAKARSLLKEFGLKKIRIYRQRKGAYLTI